MTLYACTSGGMYNHICIALVPTFLHCCKSGGKNKAPIIHYTLVCPRKWSMKSCHIPVVCIYGQVSRPSGVDNAVIVEPVDMRPPPTDNGFNSQHFTCQANGLPRTQSAIQWLCQKNCWVGSNVVRSHCFHAFYRKLQISITIYIQSHNHPAIYMVPRWSIIFALPPNSESSIIAIYKCLYMWPPYQVHCNSLTLSLYLYICVCRLSVA